MAEVVSEAEQLQRELDQGRSPAPAEPFLEDNYFEEQQAQLICADCGMGCIGGICPNRCYG